MGFRRIWSIFWVCVFLEICLVKDCVGAVVVGSDAHFLAGEAKLETVPGLESTRVRSVLSIVSRVSV